MIRVPPTFFQADSVTLNTPHTTGKSHKIIFRATKIIRTLPRIVGRGEIGPKSARLSCGVPSIRQLHLIQNAAATILTRNSKSEHITPVLRSLHWLPVTLRIDVNDFLSIITHLKITQWSRISIYCRHAH